MSPIEALEKCFFCVNGRIRHGPRGKPGEVVAFMSRSPSIKEALQKLQSEDIQDVRIDRLI